ncbi:hypothetical protein, partial [Nocardia salmonicida]|uniref:hypothetical protein n=1 Tax=Nocardia salmonicida TaxID=53431 RepID=UPI0033EDF7FC
MTILEPFDLGPSVSAGACLDRGRANARYCRNPCETAGVGRCSSVDLDLCQTNKVSYVMVIVLPG